MAQFLVPRIRGVPEASRSPLPWDEGVGRPQVRVGVSLLPSLLLPDQIMPQPSVPWEEGVGRHQLGAFDLWRVPFPFCGTSDSQRHAAMHPQPPPGCSPNNRASSSRPLPLQYIRFLTQQKAYSQIFARLLTGARKNRFVAEE